MAIKIEKDNELIEQFIKQSNQLYHYTLSDNMIGNPKYDSKYSIKLGKNLDKVVKLIIKSKTAMDNFIELLDNNDLLIAYLASEYLYPLYPQKCLKIMKDFYNKTSDKIDRFTIKTKIDGLRNKEKFFIETYKSLYDTEDLESLNRE